MPVENLIQRADLNQRLTRALDIKGQKSPILQLDNSIVGVVVVEDLTRQSDWRQPTKRMVGTHATTLGTAGELGFIAVCNPAGSGLIAVLRRVAAVGTANHQAVLGFTPNTPANAAGAFYQDSRNGGFSAILYRQGSEAVQSVIPQLQVSLSVLAPAPWWDLDGIVVNPGQQFAIQSLTVAAVMSASIWFEEIPIA